jgi:MFS family permease
VVVVFMKRRINFEIHNPSNTITPDHRSSLRDMIESKLSNSSLQPHYYPVTDDEDTALDTSHNSHGNNGNNINNIHDSGSILLTRTHSSLSNHNDQEALLSTTTTIVSTPKPLSSSSYSIGLLAITTILLFADQNLLAPNLSAVAHEFNLTPAQRDAQLGGQLSLAFFCMGAPVSLLVGYWADTTHHRPLVLASVIALGESACGASAWTTTFRQLFWCRALTGISLGGSMPLLYSLLGDLFAAPDRHIVTALLGIGMGMGIGLGQGLAGFIGPMYGWRWPFVLVSLPALFCAMLIAWTLPNPPRGTMEASALVHSDTVPQSQHATSNEAVVCDSCNTLDPLEMDVVPPVTVQSPCDHIMLYLHKYQTLLQIPTYVLALLQGGPGCLPWGVVNTYLNDYLAADRGMTVQVRSSSFSCRMIL